jgi:hypothetical protein
VAYVKGELLQDSSDILAAVKALVLEEGVGRPDAREFVQREPLLRAEAVGGVMGSFFGYFVSPPGSEGEAASRGDGAPQRRRAAFEHVRKDARQKHHALDERVVRQRFEHDAARPAPGALDALQMYESDSDDEEAPPPPAPRPTAPVEPAAPAEPEPPRDKIDEAMQGLEAASPRIDAACGTLWRMRRRLDELDAAIAQANAKRQRRG